MSARQARLFIERVHRDDAFRARVLSLHDVDARMALIRADGFDCTAEEISELLDRLGDAQLEAVRGGLTRPPQYGLDGEALCGGYGTS